jgi:hypothetical protein
MTKPYKLISIPIIEAGSQRVAGSFCATKDAITKEELLTLEHLRSLHQQATEIKKQIKQCGEKEKDQLLIKLDELRIQAKYWQEQRKDATKNKNISLGHTTLPIDGPK